ncbi:MAG: hypothetical protein G01um101444_269 [Parcubacteria group bacterium Gr01-1014_44]|nr:MAG: hypothetical protein G01um101444_269 [Parcubacteria group bacterium Gr01-1014_44]
MTMKKESSELDFSRFLRLCGCAKSEKKENACFNDKVIRFLNQSFLKTKAHFEIVLKKTKEEIQSRPLVKYGQPSELKAAWELTEISLPLPVVGNFLAIVNPEKSGISYQRASGDLAVLSAESLEPLGLFKEKNKWDEGVWELYFSLHRWQEAVRCIWAGIILHRLVSQLQQGTLLLPGISQTGQENQSFFQDQPIGHLLCFHHISHQQADELYQIYDRAHFGSRFCETVAGANFKEWLRQLNIGGLQQQGLGFAQADAVLMAGSQRDPELDIEMTWNEQVESYQFGCRIKNKDAHGFDDDSRTAYIPESILFDFFKHADQKIQEALLRLLIRGGWQKARELVFPAIKRSLD